MVTVGVKAAVLTVAASTGWTSAEIGGTTVGFLTAAAALTGLTLSIRSSNRSRKREYEQELKEAHDDGVKEAEQRLRPEIERLIDDRNNWRQQAQSWMNRGPK